MSPSAQVRIPWLTLALIAANVGMFLLVRPPDPSDVDTLVRAGGKASALVLDVGQTWRLLAANFLHKSAGHLLLNMGALLAAGGVLENTYRRIDLGLLFFASGVGALSASLWLTDAISVGASGILFGGLGAVAVLFFQHRARLPVWHRRVVSEAGLPMAVVLVAAGFVTPGVDRAAHAGGFLIGLLLTPLLRPRLLDESPRPARDAAVLAGMAVVTVALLLGEHSFSAALPPLRLERDDGFGIQLPIPREWRHAANRMGKLAFSNGLPGYGRATLAAEVVYSGEPLDALAQARRFTAESLTPAALGAGVGAVTAAPPEPVRLSGRDAVRVRAHYPEPSGETELSAYFLPRGDVVYQLVFTWPRELPRYAEVVERMVRGIVADEPRALRQARGRTLLFPSAPGALGALGAVLRQVGEPLPAVEALKEAVRQEPSNLGFRDGLARSLLQAGEVDEGCRAAKDAAEAGPERPRAFELQARCALARNDARTALGQLEAAARLAPDDERLRAALAALRATVEEQGR